MKQVCKANALNYLFDYNQDTLPSAPQAKFQTFTTEQGYKAERARNLQVEKNPGESWMRITQENNC